MTANISARPSGTGPMLSTTHSFSRSSTVIKQLARDTARTPPSSEDPPLEYVDRSLTILGRTFDTHTSECSKEFLAQREFIANGFRDVDRHFEKMDRRFEEVENKMDRRFEEVENKMDRRFEEAENKIVGKMRARLDQMENVSRNFLRTRGWEEIHPVGSPDAQGETRIPTYFPQTVKRFWRLKQPSQMHRLIYLLRFYHVQGYEEWGMDAESCGGCTDSDESNESSKSSKLPIPLEMAVRSNPEIAHRVLAAQLGLVYDEIQKFMGRAQELRQAQVIEGNKRRQDDENSTEKRRRRFKRSPEDDGTEVTSPTDILGLSEEGVSFVPTYRSTPPSKSRT